MDASDVNHMPPEVLESIQETVRTATEASRLQIDMTAAMRPVVAALTDTRSALLANVEWATASRTLAAIADTAAALTANIDWATATPALAAIADSRSALLANVEWATATPALAAIADTAAALTDTVDLSWLQGSLSQITAVTAQQDWFAQHVQSLYSSDWLEQLISETSAAPPTDLPAGTAADLEASAVAFQEQVQYLPLAEQKKLFLAFMCAIAISLGLVLAVAVQDNDTAKDVLGSVGDMIGVVGGVVSLSVYAWSRRTQLGDNDDN
ncbi:hypothetical protein [Streptomyces sp. NPDC020817]|uniref:hypothetical protein n=1 Tax=Streptomyces sp. NPDC020817 TaxID=3365095 RepID=UPI0037B9C496